MQSLVDLHKYRLEVVDMSDDSVFTTEFIINFFGKEVCLYRKNRTKEEELRRVDRWVKKLENVEDSPWREIFDRHYKDVKKDMGDQVSITIERNEVP